LKEIVSTSNFSNHKQILYTPLKYRLALLLKLIPRLWTAPIKLRLKNGGIFYVKDFMTLYIFKEIFVDHSYDYPKMHTDQPIIIDVGANAGLFSIRMKQLYPNSFIYCYEPFSSNYEQLKRNLEQSHFSGYELFVKGVGGTARKEKLFIHHKNSGGHSINQGLTDGNDYVEIELADIQSVLNNVAGKRCNLLKLDCEGAEYEIIKSLDEETAQRIESIIFENTPGQYELKELIKHLDSIGYQIGSHEDPRLVIASQRPRFSQ
jgi:FkbM family methyltransferase